MTTKEVDLIRMKGAVNAISGAISKQLDIARAAAVNAGDFGTYNRFESDKQKALEAWTEASALLQQFRSDRDELKRMESSVSPK